MEKFGDLYPKFGDNIKFGVNIIGGRHEFKAGIIYSIVGFGYGKSSKKGKRRQFWELSDKFNHQEEKKIIWKSELNRLFDENKLFETKIKKY